MQQGTITKRYIGKPWEVMQPIIPKKREPVKEIPTKVPVKVGGGN